MKNWFALRYAQDEIERVERLNETLSRNIEVKDKEIQDIRNDRNELRGKLEGFKPVHEIIDQAYKSFVSPVIGCLVERWTPTEKLLKVMEKFEKINNETRVLSSSTNVRAGEGLTALNSDGGCYITLSADICSKNDVKKAEKNSAEYTKLLTNPNRFKHEVFENIFQSLVDTFSPEELLEAYDVMKEVEVSYDLGFEAAKLQFQNPSLFERTCMANISPEEVLKTLLKLRS